MTTSQGKKPGPRGRVFSSPVFLAFTTVALALGIIMIVLGKAGYTRQEFFTSPPLSSFPTLVFSPTPSASGTPAPMPSGKPSAPATDLPGPTPTSPIFVSGTSKGAPDAPITIIEYTDFRCSICQEFALSTEKDLDKAYIQTGKVRFIYKHFIVWGDESTLAAEASEAAAEQNKFWPYHDLLMQARLPENAAGVVTTERLQSFAENIGLDMAAFNASLSSGKFKTKISADTAEGKSLGVAGTPTFFLNGIKGTGYIPFDAFRKAIEQLLGSRPSGQ